MCLIDHKQTHLTRHPFFTMTESNWRSFIMTTLVLTVDSQQSIIAVPLDDGWCWKVSCCFFQTLCSFSKFELITPGVLQRSQKTNRFNHQLCWEAPLVKCAVLTRHLANLSSNQIPVTRASAFRQLGAGGLGWKNAVCTFSIDEFWVPSLQTWNHRRNHVCDSDLELSIQRHWIIQLCSLGVGASLHYSWSVSHTVSCWVKHLVSSTSRAGQAGGGSFKEQKL